MTKPIHRLAQAGAVVVLAGLVLVGSGGRSGADGRPGWTAPLEPLEVVHGFEPPAGPYGPGHRGVDLLGVVDQAVQAAADGVVSYAGQVGGIGVVSILHGRIRTTYQPLRGTTIKTGAPVAAGDVVGRLAPSGGHCAPEACLHWGAVVDGTYIDPLGLLDPPPSRLLPYWDEGGERRAPTDDDGGPGPAAATTLLAAGSGAQVAPVAATPRHSVGGQGGPTAVAESRSLPSGVATGVAALGGLVAAAAFLAIRRRRW